MNGISIGIILVLLFACFCFGFKNTKYKQEAKRNAQKEVDKLIQSGKTEYNDLENKIRECNGELKYTQEQVTHAKELLEEKQKSYDEIIATKEKAIDERMKSLYDKRVAELESTYKVREMEEQKKFEDKVEELNKIIANEKIKVGEEKEKCADEKARILADLEDYRQKQKAINESLHFSELEREEKKAYMIMLSDDDMSDIEYLASLTKKLNHKEAIYKLIWTEFIQKPYNEMIKRQFGREIPKNVIYCLEDANGKKYIGKTQQDVSKRWADHIKTSLNIGGTPAQIHQSLYLDWNNFTFSVLEVTEKDKLTEREKYYINLYETDKYGYNMKVG